MSETYLLKGKCPLCAGDLTGNNEVDYYCKKCNILFKRTHFKLDLPKSTITLTSVDTKEKFPHGEQTPSDHDQFIPAADQEESFVDEKYAPSAGFELEEEDTLIYSNKSNKLHQGQCHFVGKIHKENRKYVASILQGKREGLELCVCLRRKED